MNRLRSKKESFCYTFLASSIENILHGLSGVWAFTCKIHFSLKFKLVFEATKLLSITINVKHIFSLLRHNTDDIWQIFPSIPSSHLHSSHDNTKMLLKLIFKASHERHWKFLFSADAVALFPFTSLFIITMHISFSSFSILTSWFFALAHLWRVVDSCWCFKTWWLPHCFTFVAPARKSRCWVSLF